MTIRKIYYPAEIDKDADSDYSVLFPDFPGCFSAGDTVDEALFNAHEALAGHVALMLEDGEKPPSPTPIETVAAKRDETTVAVTLIAVSLPGKSKRVNITLDEALLDQIDAVSGNRSRFLADAARAALYRHAHDA